jgi:hypothetical protein
VNTRPLVDYMVLNGRCATNGSPSLKEGPPRSPWMRDSTQ